MAPRRRNGSRSDGRHLRLAPFSGRGATVSLRLSPGPSHGGTLVPGPGVPVCSIWSGRWPVAFRRDARGVDDPPGVRRCMCCSVAGQVTPPRARPVPTTRQSCPPEGRLAQRREVHRERGGSGIDGLDVPAYVSGVRTRRTQCTGTLSGGRASGTRSTAPVARALPCDLDPLRPADSLRALRPLAEQGAERPFGLPIPPTTLRCPIRLAPARREAARGRLLSVPKDARRTSHRHADPLVDEGWPRGECRRCSQERRG